MLISIFDPMGVQTDRLRCEVCQNLILNPMNTGLLRHAVATALTVYGIETQLPMFLDSNRLLLSLQQLLPFTVLKPLNTPSINSEKLLSCNSSYRLRY